MSVTDTNPEHKYKTGGVQFDILLWIDNFIENVYIVLSCLIK